MNICSDIISIIVFVVNPVFIPKTLLYFQRLQKELL